MRDRVLALLALAQHPNTPLAEAESALAHASKLMLKHGITEADLDGPRPDDVTVVVERVLVRGRYRVRRQNLFYGIVKAHSCTAYRDDDEGDACVVVVYGREADIRAAKTLFAAADALAARLLPRGDRSTRVSWFKGFQRGVEEALSSARREFVAEDHGAALVLADRSQRAEREMRASGPPLRTVYSYGDAASSAYTSGVAAGRSFGTGGRSFTSGVKGELG